MPERSILRNLGPEIPPLRQEPSVTSCEVTPECENIGTGDLRVFFRVAGLTRLEWNLANLSFIRTWPGPLEVAIDYSHINAGPNWLIEEAPEGSEVLPDNRWQPLTAFAEREDFYVIDNQLLFGKEYNLHFRLRIRSAVGDIASTTPVSVANQVPCNMSSTYRELLRKWNQRARLGELRQGTLLKKKRWGRGCVECRDRDGAQQLKSQCLSCFGTGFWGGFYPAEKCFFVESSQPEQYQEGHDNSTGYSAQGPAGKFLVLNIPQIHPGDVWVDRVTDERWQFLSPMITTTRIGNVELFRTIPVVRLDFTNVIYQFPLEFPYDPAIQ